MADQDYVEGDCNGNDDDGDDDDDNHDNKDHNDDRDVGDFNINDANRKNDETKEMYDEGRRAKLSANEEPC